MRWVKGFLKWLGLLLVVLGISGAIYQAVGTRLDVRLAPPASDMVSVDSHSYHVHCEGSGSTAFVMDAGLGAWSVFWWRLQQQLSAIGRACAVDRQGAGWSDATDIGHDGVAAADEMHSIVEAAGIQKPFVYVGHSLGANFAQIYYGKYPQDVAALVLIEPGVPEDMLEDFEGTRERALAQSGCGGLCVVAQAAGHLGVGRLVSRMAPGKRFPGELKEQYRHGLTRPSHLRNVVAYLNALPKIAYQTQDVASFNDTPVIVLASSDPLEGRVPDDLSAPGAMSAWLEKQHAHFASLANKSSRGAGPVIIANSNHVTIILEELPAKDVAAEVGKLVAR